MLITKDIALKVKIKRAKNDMTKSSLAKTLSVSRGLIPKIEAGDYDAPKRIYQNIVNWLLEDA
ncbi:putative transcriptional regulator [Streptococcus dysgalactiae subsp. equisimilis]|uniref:Transcriptional regulator n=1 Tax=Streptococcus dysgalactiae subsp. equisimilis AC-2713 TaxID=759913 RepID=A0AB33R898_STREQ|nr:hypothetical protein [Streptococcus dysgalactiae]HEP4087763.1 transcriptional regulator [Streptococcus pyogenes]KKC16773.1 DNA-binding protein [Streptococcus dysgalactiae subsp. equisimilis]MBM6541226.1 transcriptional regulator [Streptococcus dysgalactiae subsp. equisimilis]OCX08538.1 DNA-binding protein [Streptococcus dysgalactiae subsp. equisimilis AKSDE4288]QJD62794.1 transcriptional regulator [Streptococcus dysgalactiae subsp. equisimilis]